MLEINDKTEKISTMQQSHIKCPTPRELYEYLSGIAKPPASKNIEHHLTGCQSCMDTFSSMARQTVKPTKQEQLELIKIRTVTPQQRVNFILSQLAEQKKKSGYLPPLNFHSIGDQLRVFFKPRVVLTVFSIVAALLVYKGGVRLQSNILARKGGESLSQLVSISFEKLRPSGDFEFSSIGRTRSTRDESDSTTLSYLKKAVSLAPNNLKAHHYLGLYYLLVDERNLEKAETHLEQAAQKETPAVLLDLGVMAWHKNEKEKAIDYFNRVLDKDPQNTHALYNLVLCYTKLGSSPRAKEAFLSLQHLEPESEWTELAREVLKKHNI